MKIDNQLNTEEDEENGEDLEEQEYKTKDCVKKWQFDYNRSTCFSDNYPEIHYKEDTSEEVSVAPGEGKIPSNILDEKDWDLKSFPCLHPDGKSSLHSERQVKLNDQDYFVQRVMNQDARFAENPAYVFAAIAYIEKKQIERNKGISFIRGKSKNEADGSKSYTLDDPYSVLDNIKNTPRYWQKTRYELIARLENLGPFNFFFTLSCADMRWPENFTALLQDQKITYNYQNGEEDIKINDEDWKEWLKANESKHEFIKSNLLNATLTFQYRVQMFVKHIIMSKSSPMKIKYNSYKVEFALRGAGHIHGVLWVDWENLDVFTKKEVKTIKQALDKIKTEDFLEPEEKKALCEFADQFITCSLKDPRTEDIVRLVNIHHHTKTCRKYGCDCRFFFPRYPCLKTIISEPVRMKTSDPEERENMLKESKEILDKVKTVLEDEDRMKEIPAVSNDEISVYKRTLKLLQKLEFIVEDNPGKLTKLVAVTDKYVIDEAFPFLNSSENLTIMKRDVVNKVNETRIKLQEIKLDELLKNRLKRLLDEVGILG